MGGFQIVHVYEATDPLTDAPNPIVVSGTSGDRFFVVATADRYNNPPPAETQVTVSSDGCEIITDSGPFPDDVNNGAALTSFTVINDSENTSVSRGTVSVEYEGVTSVFTCIDEPG